MKKEHLLPVILTTPLIFTACAAEEAEINPNPAEGRFKPDTEITIVIVYDNNEYDSHLTTAWGFSCVVKLPQKTILFDTGGNGSILLSNMAKLDIKPEEIDTVVLSHAHVDHSGGLDEFLRQNSRVTVYMPLSFAQGMKQDVESRGGKVKQVHEPHELFEGLFTTGEINSGVREQSLLIKTFKGLAVITGCAHPGVVNTVKRAKEITKDKIYLVIGGFHLIGASPSQLNYIAESLLDLGVERVAPCHCSGDEARNLFKKCFGENYIGCGVGKKIII
ncbi:MAG: MBL fold metallo-hydrolase [Chloroflexota bacterium]|nr:MBL fold metallo-hydrolase [Chloroflexota bacterium]